jgi:tetratricopeptide (TPR) repeat protein
MYFYALVYDLIGCAVNSLKPYPLKFKINHSLRLSAIILIVWGCSTKKDTFLSRNSHALSTKYNILYNGEVAELKGLEGIESKYADNFWELLPIEKMSEPSTSLKTTDTKNADFDLAETKATKAIQKHSMNIDGRERNYQTDEAYFLLGQARYFEQRYIPALDAFNYILYKYPNSSNIYEAKIWREKTNMRLGNDAVVIDNVMNILVKHNLTKEIVASANALMAEAYLNMNDVDCSIEYLKVAVANTNTKNQKARYHFILGQMYQDKALTDSALYHFQSVIDMNRKCDRKYLMHAQQRKAQLFNYKNGDTIIFLKNLNKMIANRENRPFLDLLLHQKAVFYDSVNKKNNAIKYYNASLNNSKKNLYTAASNYRNIAKIHFNNSDYQLAAKYYDSTLIYMDPKKRETIHTKKLRTDLDDVIMYQNMVAKNDSIIRLMNMSPEQRVTYFEEYIQKLKLSDSIKNVKAELATKKQEEPKLETNNVATKSTKVLPSNFYFYNEKAIAFGANSFKKAWGDRSKMGYWRTKQTIANTTLDTLTFEKVNLQNDETKEQTPEKYTTDYYLQKLILGDSKKDSITKQTNYANCQLGINYKDKFKKNELATEKFETVLASNPEDKIKLTALYNLYKIYLNTDALKADAIKTQIITNYPDSRFAQILTNKIIEDTAQNNPDVAYANAYKMFENEDFDALQPIIEASIKEYEGDEIASKFEFLKAKTIGKTNGLAAYKTAIEYVAKNYPNTNEGKASLNILSDEIAYLEGLEFTNEASSQWRILYKLAKNDKEKLEELEKKIQLLIIDENSKRLSISIEKFNQNDIFVVINGFQTESYSKVIATLLKENKKYNVLNEPLVISKNNYKILQIKKDIENYKSFNK